MSNWRYEVPLEIERKEAIKIAKELYYSDYTIHKLESAKNLVEIGNIMKTARLKKNWG
jgi:hypothetical protein